MRRSMKKLWLTLCIGLAWSGVVTPAHADWSQEWTQNYSPEVTGPFTKMEFLIMPGATGGVTFKSPTSISSSSGSATAWTSELSNSECSFLTGSMLDSAVLRTYFSGPSSAVFNLEFILWNGNSIIERQEFKWLGGHWQNPRGTLLENDPVAPPVPIPPTILLLAPAGLGVFLLRKRLSQG